MRRRFSNRKLTGLIQLIIVIGLPTWLICSSIRQHRLDHALITAIKRRDDRSVTTLLAHGADPNALDAPKANGSIWQLLLEFLRGKQASTTICPTALQVAIRVDLDNAPPAQQEQSYAVIKALCARGAAAPSNADKAEISLEWADRLLNQVPDRPRMSEDSGDLSDADQAFRDIILKYGPSSRAYAGLAECRSRQYRYSGSVYAYRLALLWSPRNAVLQTKLQRMEEILQVSQSVTMQLSHGDRVLCVCPYPIVTGTRGWAIITGHAEDTEDFEDRPHISNVHLALYAQSKQGYTRLCQSGQIVDPQLRGGYSPFNDVRLDVFDMLRSGVPQLVVHEIFYGANWAPSHMDIFAWRQRRMVHILDVSSSEPLWIEDIRHDGRYEVRNVHGIGSMSYAAQPKWSDIYSYKNGEFVRADWDFPGQFTSQLGTLQNTLEHYSGDDEILEYLALTYETERHPQKALATYREAERICSAQLNIEADREGRAVLRTELRQIRDRIHALARREARPLR